MSYAYKPFDFVGGKANAQVCTGRPSRSQLSGLIGRKYILRLQVCGCPLLQFKRFV